MLSKLTLKTLLTIICVAAFFICAVQAQSNVLSAKERLERAISYGAAGDPRAEQECRQAIAESGGVYPEAWEWLSRHLARELRFNEAATAWRKYLEQTNEKVQSPALERLDRLDRGAQLKGRSDKGEILSSEEMLELIKLVDGFGSRGDAIPYAEKAAKLHPGSAKVLVALADLIRYPQKERALVLLTEAIALEPHEPTIYVARGWCFFWAFGSPSEAETDFRRAIELSNGANASAWAGLGDSLARQAKRNEAIAAYRKYLSVRPNSAAHYDGEIRKSIAILQSNSSHP